MHSGEIHNSRLNGCVKLKCAPFSPQKQPGAIPGSGTLAGSVWVCDDRLEFKKKKKRNRLNGLNYTSISPVLLHN